MFRLSTNAHVISLAMLVQGRNFGQRASEVRRALRKSAQLTYAEKGAYRTGGVNIEDVLWNAWGTARDERVG
jgi:hypothetical protein